MPMKPCKHLDYTPGKLGPDITLETIDGFSCPVRFWLRGPRWTDAGPGQPPNPSRVQFCGAGRGRINGVFQCYNAGELSCYEPQPDLAPTLVE